MKSYDYTRRKGVEAISWLRFADLAGELAQKLAAQGVEAVVGIARAGLFPAAAIACSLRCDLHPLRVTRRVGDAVVYPHPVWKTPIPNEVAGRVIAVVDEIADSGETLAMVAGEVRARGAARVLTACLVSHTWADPKPDLVGLLSDALVIFPWDARVLVDGRWQLHPELVQALLAQGLDASAYQA